MYVIPPAYPAQPHLASRPAAKLTVPGSRSQTPVRPGRRTASGRQSRGRPGSSPGILAARVRPGGAGRRLHSRCAGLRSPPSRQSATAAGGPAMARHQAQHQRGLAVMVEIRPVHRHQRVATAGQLMRHPAGGGAQGSSGKAAGMALEGKLSHTSMPLLLSSRSTCLTACLVTRPRACANAWPIIATASDAAAITPRAAPAKASIRLACKSGP